MGPGDVVGMQPGEERLDGALERLPVVAEEFDQPVVPAQLAGEKVVVEAPDAGCVDGQVEAEPAGFVLLGQGRQFELRGHGVGQLTQEGDVPLGPLPRLRAEDAQGADDAPPGPDERHAEVGADRPGDDDRQPGGPRVRAGVGDDHRLRREPDGHGAQRLVQRDLAADGPRGQARSTDDRLDVAEQGDAGGLPAEQADGEAGEPLESG